jgi:hypothetical protein
MATNGSNDPTDICIALLVKDKGYCLPFFLKCFYNQTFPKSRMHLYIRTNDNKDNSQQILESWLEKHRDKYASVHYDASSINTELKQYGEHQWNKLRFKVLGAIRQASVDYARERSLHYFVIDCDNFLVSDTIEKAFENRHLGVIGPALESMTRYANLHHCATEHGYYKECGSEYDAVRYGRIKGLIECDVIHCTYLIPYWALSAVTYDDGSGDYEYVIFSNAMRKAKIPQIFDNRKFYGFLFNKDTVEESLYDLADVWSVKYSELF